MDIKAVNQINKGYINTFKNNNIKEEDKSTSQQYDGRYNNYFTNSLSQSRGTELYKRVDSLNNVRKVEAVSKTNEYTDLETQEKYKRVDILV
jgi:tryptophan synthase beta subunit